MAEEKSFLFSQSICKSPSTKYNKSTSQQNRSEFVCVYIYIIQQQMVATKDGVILLLSLCVLLLLLKEYKFENQSINNTQLGGVKSEIGLPGSGSLNFSLPSSRIASKAPLSPPPPPSVPKLPANVSTPSPSPIKTPVPTIATTKETTDPLSKVKNSAYVTKVLSSFPPSWQKPLLLAAIADEKYIYSAQVFVESLITVGFGLEDIVLMCTSDLCGEQLAALHIPHVVIHKKECDGNMRCLISEGKSKLVIDVLSKGYSIFLFDLDIYFKAPILEGLTLSDSIEMYVQNNNDFKYPYDALNYGMFLLRPSMANILFFQNISTMYKETKKWDQWIFNKVVEQINHPHALLPDTEYYLHTSQKTQNIRAVHLICIEGTQIKMFIGRELYGPFKTPSYYNSRKTLSVTFDSSYSYNELVGLISILIKICKHTNRWLRVLGFNYQNSKSLFDADKLFHDDDIMMVESKYWENFKLFNASHNISSSTIEIDSVETLFTTFTTNSSLIPTTDDLVLTINQGILQHFFNAKYTPYICKFYNQGRYQCLESCQGNHFRLRTR